MIFGIAPKRQKSDDKLKLGGPCRHFGPQDITFEVPFGIVFSLFLVNDRKARKVFVFQYFSMVLNHQKPLIFQSFFHRFFMFFQSRSPGPFLEGPSAELLWKVRCWCHFRFSGFPKRLPFDYLFRQKAEFGHAAFPEGASLSRPCFSRNHSNYCAVGTYWFLKRHFSDGDWLNFVFLYFFCAMFYIILLSLLCIKPR